MWTATGFGKALVNSLYVSTLATVLSLIIAIPVGYALSRFRFAGRSNFRRFLLITQMLSPIVLVLGLFRISLDVVKLLLHHSTGPRGGRVDGGRIALTALRRVFLPSQCRRSRPALFTFVNSWNEFVLALTRLRSDENYTLPIQILSMVSGRYSVEWHLVMAAALCASLPVAIMFAWMQRYMLRGLTAGAVK